VPLTPEQRVLRARKAVYTSWANTADPAARTASARRAALDRFEKQIDPDGTLDPAERGRRADAARSAYFAGLALRSSKARAARKAKPAHAGAVSEYLSSLPAAIPAGRVLVHNHVRPARVLGSRGSRAWLEPSDADGLEICGCDWAPELGDHYRVGTRYGGDVT
jgi:hypothetical protein